LIGGSFFAGPLADSEDPPPEPEEPPSDPDEPPSDPDEPPSVAEEPLEPAGAFAGVVGALAAGAGVGSGSDSGDEVSPADAEEDDSPLEPDAVVPEDAVAGSTTFSDERADASVSATLEPAA
jgi:hypothetical protein